MRFAFITTMGGYPWGGSEELWQQTALRLKEEGHEVMASVIYWPRLSENVTAMKDKGIKLQVRRYINPGTLSRRIWNKISRHRLRCYSEVKNFKPDLVVVAQGHNAGGFDWAEFCHEAELPYVMIVQCNFDVWWFGSVVDSVRANYVRAKRIFCVSQGNLNLLRMQVGDPLLHGEVVWNPYKVSRENPPAWPDDANGWRLACVARIELAAKGHDLLFKTLALPEWRARAVEVNLYGAGPDDALLRRHAEMLQLKNVCFQGHVHNVRSIWAENHLLVMPSRFEGLPLALVEAMCCARPAVVTDVGGNAEVCIDGVTGFVAPAATLASISSTLERAWERRNDWESMGKAARSRVEELVPNDPVGIFTERLKAAAGQSVALNESIEDHNALSPERL